ncbi:MAG: glycosyltransferase [Candidatus Aquirickettsiella sp.]
MDTLRSYFTHLAYRCYVKLPRRLKTIVKKGVGNRYFISDRLPTDTASRRDIVNFINQITSFVDRDNAVFLVQPTILNCLGTEFYNGGAERYVLDLAKLLVEQGYTVYCVQYALDRPWIRNYYGLTIIGLPSIIKQTLFRWCVSQLTQGAALVISSPFNLVTKEHAKKILGISHGIFWDHPTLNKQVTNILQSINSLDALVTVDTATLNVIRSQQIKNVDKVVFIPNYVDRKKFFPVESTSRHEELVILYPRRLYTPRGFWMVQELVPRLLHEFDFISFLFCGKAENAEMEALKILIQRYGDKVKHRVCPPSAMGAVYHQADIVLIPTLHSEGTSMSLIEAMASKKAIIATYVGGLTDLISDRFNGLMVYPHNKEELYQAIKAFIVDKTLREDMAKNAYKKSLAFDISLWKEKWLCVLGRLLKERETKLDPISPWTSEFSLVHMHAPGITFDVMVQRPQQLFKALSLLGTKCFFLEDKPGNQQQMINKNLIISSREADVDFSGMIAYTYFASNYVQLKNNKPQWLIYDVLDTPDIHNCSDYLENHAGMLAAADMVITSSQLLYQQYRHEFTEKIIKYIPNAATPSDWISTNGCKPIDFPCYAHKTIGYYGALAEWVDYSLLDKLCLGFPNSQLLLIGPCRETYPEYKQLTTLVEKHNNLFYLGLKKYTELVNYAHYFDVGIIPHVAKHTVTQASSQVKLYEYMHVGIPIVTSDIPDCRQYQSAQIAKSHDEFLALVHRSLNMQKEDPYFKMMKKEAEENTWQVRASCVLGAIHEHFSVE